MPYDHLVGGITPAGEGQDGVIWQGQNTYYLKAICETTFCFETFEPPGAFVPLHIHTSQDEFIYVLEGQLELQLAEAKLQANRGDLVRLPHGVPHAYANSSTTPARTVFWVSPAGKLKQLFDAIRGVEDFVEIVRISAAHDVIFLPRRG